MMLEVSGLGLLSRMLRKSFWSIASEELGFRDGNWDSKDRDGEWNRLQARFDIEALSRG